MLPTSCVLVFIMFSSFSENLCQIPTDSDYILKKSNKIALASKTSERFPDNYDYSEEDNQTQDDIEIELDGEDSFTLSADPNDIKFYL